GRVAALGAWRLPLAGPAAAPPSRAAVRTARRHGSAGAAGCRAARRQDDVPALWLQRLGSARARPPVQVGRAGGPDWGLQSSSPAVAAARRRDASPARRLPAPLHALPDRGGHARVPDARNPAARAAVLAPVPRLLFD